jgi:sugar lactone lactonase YvrE
MGRALPIAALLAAAALACSSQPVTPLLLELEEAAAEAPQGPQWPAPPGEARIAYLGAIAGESSFEPRPSLWRRIATVFTGDRSRRFVRPAAACVRDATLALADPGSGLVHVLDLEARRWESISHSADGPLQSPVSLACLPDGRILVSDSGQAKLWVYGPDAVPLGAFGETPLERPTGVAYDEVNTRLWVSETLAHRVRAFDLQGRELLRVGARGAGSGEFNYPTMLADDGEGGVWVTDSLNFRLQHVDSSGRIDRAFGVAGDRAGSFARPRGLAVDAEGRIFAVDALLDAVQIFDPSGQLLLAFGGRGTGPGQLWLPADVALDGRGHAYVVDSYNRRVQVFAYRPPTGS